MVLFSMAVIILHRYGIDAHPRLRNSGPRGGRPSARVFDRVFAGVRFAEVDGPLLYIYARDELAAAEIEDDFALLIVDVASAILRHQVELVVVLPKVLQ